jgi:hypothetical protein
MSVALLAVVGVPAQADQHRPKPTDVGPSPGTGVYVIQSCGESGSTDGWSLTRSNMGALAGGAQCPPVEGNVASHVDGFDQTGLWLSDRLATDGGDPEAAFGDRAELTFTPVAGTVVTRLQYSRKVFKYADDNWLPYVAVGSRSETVDTCEMAGAPICEVGGDDWYPDDPNDEIDRSSYRDLSGRTAGSIILGLYCRDNDTHACGNGFSIPHVEVQIYSAFLTIADPSPPVLGAPDGEGWTASGWVQGRLPLGVSSTDNTGISATRVYADGSLIATMQGMCRYDRPRPCDDEVDGEVGLPTAGLADGPHVIQLAAADAANNETRLARSEPLMVDNRAPVAPVGLTAAVARSAVNSFSASWGLPADAGSPIVGARYRVCRRGVCGAAQSAPALTSVSGLTLPAVGDGTLRVWLVDQLGHADEASAATLPLTYAPVAAPPAPLTPEPAPTPLPLPQPPPPHRPAAPTKLTAALKLSTVRRHARRVTITGRLSRRASGHVTVRYAARTAGRLRTVSHRATIRAGAFRSTFTLSRTVAAARSGTITVAYAGDADTKRATARSSLRIRSR